MSFIGDGLPITWWGGSRPTSHVMPPIRRQTLPTDAAPPPPPEIPPGPGRKGKVQGIEIINVPIRASTGLQTIIIPRFGKPKGALFIMNSERDISGYGTVRPHAIVAMGATDGTNQWAVAAVSQSALGTSRTAGQAATNKIMILLSASVATEPDVEISFHSWVKDGVRISVDTNNGTTSYLLTVVFFGGKDVQEVFVGASVLATQNNTVTVTPGFEMNALIACSHQRAFSGADSANAIFTHGYASYDGSTILQSAHLFRSDHGGAVTIAQAEVVSTGVVSFADSRYVVVENILSTAFDFLSTGGDLSAMTMGYIALKLSSRAEAWVGIVDSPTSVGAETFTGPSFRSTFGLMTPNTIPIVNTNYDDGQGCGVGIYAFTKTNGHMHSWSEEDGVTTMNSQNVTTKDVLDLDDDGGTDDFDATFGKFEGSGVTFNFSRVDGTVRKWPLLLIKAKK